MSDNIDRTSCYSPSIYVYSLRCNAWSELTQALNSSMTPRGRLASDMFVRDNLIYSVGGFVGYPVYEFMVLQHDRCAWYTLPSTCLNDTLCGWTDGAGCAELPTTPLVAYPSVGITRLVTTLPLASLAACNVCSVLTTQPECDRNLPTNGCVWCPANATCLTVLNNSTDPDQLAPCMRSSACFASA